MTNRYIDLIEQTFDPAEGFKVIDGCLYFHDVPLKKLVEEYGTPLRLTYLPKISSQIQKAKHLFELAYQKNQYDKPYRYCFCTKSSHFSYVLNEALKNDIHLEISSNYDIDLLYNLYSEGKISKDTFVICNGFKPREYIRRISELINQGHHNVIGVIDNMEELNFYSKYLDPNVECKIGIRVAAEEEPTFEFYTSRLGVRYKDILPFYENVVKKNPRFKLNMLHFFINTGIKDDTYYWNELVKLIHMYCELKKACPELTMLNIGGGLPIRYSLDSNIDYEYLINEIVYQIKDICERQQVDTPEIFTEFGSFTVGESGAIIFTVLAEKHQNDRESWYMLDGSMMTTLPDIYGIKQRFILLPINKWNYPYQTVTIGGLSCDGNDFYSSKLHRNNLYLPCLNQEGKGVPAEAEDEKLYLGFFHVGAYQESLSGFGGIKHCLLPSPKHVLIQRDSETGEITTELFSQEQTAGSMLKILGYAVQPEFAMQEAD
ncbi:MAG: arginine decarboxylase [Sphingobacteriales bacterium]|nr:MAG: arginine decarboxylase [Sphingobacteriales bacterium]